MVVVEITSARDGQFTLAHFYAHVVEKRAQALPLRGGFAHRLHQREKSVRRSRLFLLRFSSARFAILPPAFCLLISYRTTDDSHCSHLLAASCENLAGEEGFEPPLSVLETDGLPLNLTPYNVETSTRRPTLELDLIGCKLEPDQDRWRRRLPPASFSSGLLNFLMAGVLPARIAELRGLQPLGMLAAVLRRRVIPVLTIVALQCDDFSHGRCTGALGVHR